MKKVNSFVRKWSLVCPNRKKYICSAVLFLFALDYFGVFMQLFEVDFDSNFRYPYEGDVTGFAEKLRRGLKPEHEPINFYNYTYITTASGKCSSSEKLKLIYLVKSSVDNFERRNVIRYTWGFEKRFSDVAIRTVFILGLSNSPELQQSVNEEYEKHKDIVQLDFVDSYYNNTIKTMCAFKWVIEYCPEAQFYFFSDDDMYISTKNVLLFLRHPTKYPKYLQLPENLDKSANPESADTILKEKKSKHIFNIELPPDVILFAGYVFISTPHRHKSSKWFVSLKEYPYNYWPPYVTAGAYVLSREALIKMYYTSFYTKHFRFDDIYLGLVALKAGIELYHCEEFHFYKKEYTPLNYKYVIASHGYSNVRELFKVWNEQKARGYA